MSTDNPEVDLFGNVIESRPLLREKYGELPFTLLDAKSGSWQKRKSMWKDIGMKGEAGRDVETFRLTTDSIKQKTSIFDPVLCELMYKWFCPEHGRILDPFAGGDVRGIVAGYLGYDYTGIDIRPEQIESNRNQADTILTEHKPQYICGDSNVVLDIVNDKFDMVFSCPPYGNLEVYSDIEGDISNMDYDKCIESYRSIIRKSCDKLVSGGFACFVVGEFRACRNGGGRHLSGQGEYVGFVPDTVRAFMDCGMLYYNEAIIVMPYGTACLRADGNMKTKKMVKVHQNVLIFKKV